VKGVRLGAHRLQARADSLRSYGARGAGAIDEEKGYGSRDARIRPPAGEVARGCEKVATVAVRVDRRDDQQGEFGLCSAPLLWSLPTKTSFGPDRKKQLSRPTNDLQKLFHGSGVR